MRFSFGAAILLGTAGILAAGTRPAAQNRTLELMRRWSGAVMRHAPGASDAPLAVAWQLSETERANVLTELPDFLDKIRHPTQAPPASMWDVTNPISNVLTATEFIERAAAFHADAVLFDSRPPSAAHAPTMSDAARRSASPLSRTAMREPQTQTRVLTTSNDGDATGAIDANPNWPFARRILDLLGANVAANAFVPLWYHATTAYMLSTAAFGEVGPHLAHASVTMATNDRILFDRACVFEADGMSPIQELRVDLDRSAAVGGTRNLDVPTRDVANARAIELYQQVITLNPSFVEAHVRLARLLELSGKSAEAAAEVRRALALDPPAEVAYFAHLFGVRAANALDRSEEAEAHAQAALGLFPEATSAIIAASQTALRRANMSSAMEYLARLASANPLADPWHEYLYGPGRDPKLPMTELWALVPRPRSQ